jgi:hypothetical protein
VYALALVCSLGRALERSASSWASRTIFACGGDKF